MKKLLLIILIGAGCWWFFGADDATNESAAEKLDAIVAGTHATYEAITAEDFPARAQRLYNFETAVEDQLHREQFVPLDEMPIYLRQAIIATEDKRFYEHGPIDFISIARAMFNNYQAGETVEGGSTISQQTVKNIFLAPDRSWLRKFEEMLLASRLERLYTKDEILEMYLNTIYYGAGAYGIGEAAEIYFGVEVSDLNLAQCALLAGLPQAPSALNPFTNYEGAKARQQTVLALMTRQGMISPEMAKKAYNEDLGLVR